MDTLASFQSQMMGYFTSITLAAAALAFALAAFYYLTSAGSPDKMKKVKEYATNGVIAIAVVALVNTFLDFLRGLPAGTNAFSAFKFIQDSFDSAAIAVIDFGIAVAGFMVAYGGILYMTASGTPEKTQKAIKVISTSLTGLVIMLVFASLYNFIAAFFFSK